MNNYLLVYTTDPVDRREYLVHQITYPNHLLSSDLEYHTLLELLNQVLHEPYSLLELQHPFRTVGCNSAEEYSTAMRQSLKISQDRIDELEA